MCIEEIEKMISSQKRTIQNAVKITKEFKSGYMAALNTLSASIEMEKHLKDDDLYLQQIV